MSGNSAFHLGGCIIMEHVYLINVDSAGGQRHRSLIWEANHAIWHASVLFASAIPLYVIMGLELLDWDACNLLNFDGAQVLDIAQQRRLLLPFSVRVEVVQVTFHAHLHIDAMDWPHVADVRLELASSKIAFLSRYLGLSALQAISCCHSKQSPIRSSA